MAGGREKRLPCPGGSLRPPPPGCWWRPSVDDKYKGQHPTPSCLEVEPALGCSSGGQAKASHPLKSHPRLAPIPGLACSSPLPSPKTLHQRLPLQSPSQVLPQGNIAPDSSVVHGVNQEFQLMVLPNHPPPPPRPPGNHPTSRPGERGGRW